MRIHNALLCLKQIFGNEKWSTGLFFVATKLAHAHNHMGGHAFKKHHVCLTVFLRRVLGMEIFVQVGENPLCSVNLLIPDGLHSNEAGEFTAGT